MGWLEYIKKCRAAKIEKQQDLSQQKKLGRKIGGTILYLVFVLALIYFTPKFLSYALNTQYPLAAITSGSMWPALKQYDLIFIQGIDARQVKIGDIVVYTNQKKAFTIHRVIELREDTIVTKGDANNVADKAISYEDIVGRLYRLGNWDVRIPKLGYISTSFSKFINK
ncbi:MAG: signal peptidase I [Patescibacteria group bacterium]